MFHKANIDFKHEYFTTNLENFEANNALLVTKGVAKSPILLL